MSSHIKSRAFSISEITRLLKSKVESTFSDILIEGEVSNLNFHRSGHAYLTLKDDAAVIRAIIFNYASKLAMIDIVEGDKIIVFGRISLYEKKGEYSFIVESVEKSGAGFLFRKFEEIKNRLFKEGLFDEKRKKPIPAFARSVGIITAPHSAALNDIFKVVRGSKFGLELIVFPVPVQGVGASKKIIDAIRYFNTSPKRVEVLLIARGGGSFEDLNEFNDEAFLREMGCSGIPIITGIGHEVDFTLADFVADLRTPTPSAGAMALPNSVESAITSLSQYTSSMAGRLERRVDGISYELNSREIKFREIDDLYFDVDDLGDRIDRAIEARISHYEGQLENYFLSSLSGQKALFICQEWSLVLIVTIQRIANAVDNILESLAVKLDHFGETIGLLNPDNILSRGYSITLRESDRTTIGSIAQIDIGERIVTRMVDGEARSTVTAKGERPL